MRLVERPARAVSRRTRGEVRRQATGKRVPARLGKAGSAPARGGMEQHSNIMTGSEHFNTLIEKVYSDSL